MSREIPLRNGQTWSGAATGTAPALQTAGDVRAAAERAVHQGIIKIVYGTDGKVVEAPVETLGEYSASFHKAILIIEDSTADADRCRAALEELGYDGIQLITKHHQALEYMDDVLNNLTRPPDAIVLDLGLGYDSGFDILRKCHADPKLKHVPLLVWSRCGESHTKSLSTLLGAKDFLVKSPDKEELKLTLQRLLTPEARAGV